MRVLVAAYDSFSILFNTFVSKYRNVYAVFNILDYVLARCEAIANDCKFFSHQRAVL